MIFNTIIANKNDTVLIPAPLYPLFSAAGSLNGGSMTLCYMDEDNGWQINIDKMQKAIEEA